MSTFLILVLAAFVYVATITVTLFASQPIRLRLVALAAEIQEEPGRTKAETDELEWLVTSCTSTAVGWLMPVAAFMTLVSTLLGGSPRLEPELRRLYADDRFGRVILLYVGSLAGSSPFAALVTAPIIAAVVVAASLRHGSGAVRTIEASVIQASARFQTA